MKWTNIWEMKRIWRKIKLWIWFIINRPDEVAPEAWEEFQKSLNEFDNNRYF